MYISSGTELINPFTFLERVGIRAGQRVADLGCGSLGHFVFPAAQLVGGTGVVYAVDIQKPVLERIERLAKEQQFWNVTPVWSDIDVFGATRIEPASLDLTLLVNNLFLSRNRPALVREMARLTRPGGRLAVAEWKPTASPLGPPAEQRLNAEEAKKILTSPFFTFLDEFDVGPYHYGFVYVRSGQDVT